MPSSYHVPETVPCIALLLAAPVQPIKQASQDPVSKGYHCWKVSINPIVMVVAGQYLIELSYNVHSLHDAHVAELVMNILTLLNKFLPACFPPHSELSVHCFRADMCKSKEIKCLRFSFVTSAALFFREPSEFNQPAFFFRQT